MRCDVKHSITVLKKTLARTSVGRLYIARNTLKDVYFNFREKLHQGK